MATLKFNPKDILYHYCSTEAFHSIVTTHSIRLSSLSLSNDSMEGKMVAEALSRLAERDKCDQRTITLLQKQFEVYLKDVDGFGFCLSKQRDQLSQWRGYADDATGVAIGFSQEYLELLQAYTCSDSVNDPGFTLEKVVYDQKEHEAKVLPLYEELKKTIDNRVPLEAKKDSFLKTRSNDPELQKMDQLRQLLASQFYLQCTILHLFSNRQHSLKKLSGGYWREIWGKR